MTRRVRRNPVLAPLTRWLWWSPWHLLAAAVSVVLVAALVSAALRGEHPAARSTPRPLSSSVPVSASPSASASSAETAGSSGSPPTTSVTPSLPPPALAGSPSAAAAAALAWVRLWARPTLAPAPWLESLRPLTYVEYLNVLATVRPATVPASAVAGAAKMQRFATGAAHVLVPVRGGEIRGVDVAVMFEPMTGAGRWLVTGVEPA